MDFINHILIIIIILWTLYYVSELSFTYSSNPPQHIWTLACGCSERGAFLLPCKYPCSIYPGNNPLSDYFWKKYYCESHFTDHPNNSATMLLYFNDTLWDRAGCIDNNNIIFVMTLPNLGFILSWIKPHKMTMKHVYMYICSYTCSWSCMYINIINNYNYS